ncbi:MAG: PD40 domain-containing protein [Chloroflexi bacterium]|nr:PD40 domain-containing protein [Chloroflexota bacterium]
MRTAVVSLIALAALLLACGGDSARPALPKEADQPGTIIYFRQSPAPQTLVAVNADGSGERQLFPIEPDNIPYPQVISAACIPDGDTITYMLVGEDLNGEYQRTLISANLDGSDARKLPSILETAWQPSWSRDGKSIAFVRVERGAPFGEYGEIWVADSDGSNPRLLTSGPDASPVWSPDGQRIAFSSVRDGNMEVYTITIDGMGLTNLTQSEAGETGVGWSPDGRRILFSSISGNAHLMDLVRSVHSMDTDGSNKTTFSLAAPEELVAYPAWGPINAKWSLDGKLFAFTAPVPSGSGGDQVTISGTRALNASVGVFVSNADGTDPHRVDSAESAILLTWCPDSPS